MPNKKPANVEVIRDPDEATVLVVTWESLNIIEARGFITYKVVATPTSDEGADEIVLSNISNHESGVTLTGADPAVTYKVRVFTQTSSGELGPG